MIALITKKLFCITFTLYEWEYTPTWRDQEIKGSALGVGEISYLPRSLYCKAQKHLSSDYLFIF